MLDMKFVRANLDRVREGARLKRIEVDFDRLVTLDDERKEILGEEEGLRNRQKTAGKEIAQLQGDEKQAAIAALGEIPERIKAFQERRRAVEEELEALAALVHINHIGFITYR